MGAFRRMQFALILCDQEGKKITGTSSVHQLEKTRAVAQNLLALVPSAAYCEIHLAAPDGWDYLPEVQETVQRAIAPSKSGGNR